MNNYVVYAHIAPNGKAYIGITSRQPEKRWGIGGKRYKDSPLFWNAINKYGWENIEHKIIKTELSKGEAEKREKEFIAKFKSRNPEHGYNLTDGGCGMSGYQHTESGKMKLSVSGKGRIHTAEARANMAASHVGSKRSEETRKKMSASLLGNKRMLGNKHALETKEKIGEAHKGRTFSEETIAKMSAAKVGTKSRKEFRHTEETKEKLRIAKKRAKDIECLTLDGEVIKKYSSPARAEEETGIRGHNIRSACSGKTHSAGGYKWRYARQNIPKGATTNKGASV